MFNAQSALVVARRIAEPPAEPRHPEFATAVEQRRARRRVARVLIALRRRRPARAGHVSVPREV